MINRVDNLTLDLFGAGRGRPSAAGSLQVSERVKKHREQKQNKNIATITFDLDLSLKNAISTHCKNNNITRSEFIASLISAELLKE